MQDFNKLSESELLALAKTSDDSSELNAIASLNKLPRKVALEICKRKEVSANAAKLTIAGRKDTEDSVLMMLLDNPLGIEKAAWESIEQRIEKRTFKDKDAYYDVADLAISQWKSGKGSWLLSFKALAQIFKDFEDFREDIIEIPGALNNSEIKKLAANSGLLNESHLLEASYLQLAQQTASKSQLQKLAESQFESVREIAKSRALNESLADIKKLFVVEKVTTLRINTRDVISKLKTLIAVFSKFREFDKFKGLLEQVLAGVEKQEGHQYFLKLFNDVRFNIHGFDKDAIALLDSEQLRGDLDDVLSVTSLLSGSSLPKDVVYSFE